MIVERQSLYNLWFLEIMDKIQELREIVNPVFNTAKACVQLDAISGDAESQQLLAILGIDELERDSARKPVPPELAEQVKKLFPVYTIYTESRFQIVNRLIEAYPGRTVVDLPCGYTARGIKRSGKYSEICTSGN